MNDVTADGALYFSSAGNEGNFNDGTASVWEGDFRVANGTIPALTGAGDLHNFGAGVFSNRVESSTTFVLALFWSDPLGQSANDYDFYILNSTLTGVSSMRQPTCRMATTTLSRARSRGPSPASAS